MTLDEHNRIATLMLEDFNTRLNDVDASAIDAAVLLESVVVSFLAHLTTPDSHCEICCDLFNAVHARLHDHFNNLPSQEIH